MKLKAYDVVVDTMLHGHQKIGVTAKTETMAEIYAVNIARDRGYAVSNVVSISSWKG